ncbi:PREDICTED: uncharacterized protein LOC105138939 [Populus euphratica]|uniref:Uncharacterized protein LOC105138939 n=1 Tax=Populus euphratica TaxID=75702 RepID=A0AAJ6V9H1_POPEU|nr:PREDICTED: uncharacterized protein LOC105138939 [Populus euphratica]XP_011043489.1 PREDICTED: uncharacterized protein LOC105138939 [Populus euphratica]XP_011043490.1 PREDICTED: uncharacterized protein LOC105138939 [Populus euphratica]XP_011043491.1 PREDICTED: uncharacterized protein LOC105138939 [Populus euphratica]XP_011043492.1 PREDICTED: uncharacterized protein LOC105138939 [Populus euphratica]
MYRSFVTCDDPKGVVECGTIRKSKSGSHKMEHKIISHKAQKSSKADFTVIAEKKELVSKGIAEEYRTPSSFQLLEVSRGAQKLNQTVNSWSKGLSSDGQSKDIAKDLLKGALDMQESLLMLGKLQEASHYMAQLKRQKEKLKRGKINEVRAEMMNSHQFGGLHCQTGFQRPLRSADGSSNYCIDELKKAITDSLGRHNLLPNRTTQEKTYKERRKRDSASDVPSTSSSQSSVAQSSSSHSTRSISTAAPPRKENSPNLIAKLMGLEDMPSKPLQKHPHKQLDVETDLSRRRPRPVFDIEMPKVRKPQPLMHKVRPEQRALKDILETMQFKGLLKCHSVKELKSCSHHSRETHTNRRSSNYISPIVLIKPGVSCFESKEVPASMVWKMGTLKAELMPRKVKLKKGPEPDTRSVGYKEGTYSTCKMLRKTEVDEPTNKRLGQEEGTKDRREVVVITEEKDIKTVVQDDVAVRENKGNAELEPEETLIKTLSKERVEDLKDAVPRAEEQRIKTKLKGSSKLKASCPVANQQQKKETAVKKVNKTQRVDTDSRKRIETEVVKPKNVSRSQEQAKVISTKTRIENGSMTTKTQVTQQSSTNQKSILKHTTKTTVHSPKDHRRKIVAEPTTEKPTNEELGCKEDDKKKGHKYDADPVSKVTNTPLADQPSTEEEANVLKFHNEEHCSDSQSSPCNHTLVTSEHEEVAKSPEEANNDTGLMGGDGESSKNGIQLNALLLSSPLFLTRAEELFDLNMNSLETFPTSGICDYRIASMELSLDYANEYIELRSCVDSQTRHPLLQTCTGDPRLNLSLEELVEEVVNGAKTLTSYCKLGFYNPPDETYGILEKDIRCGSGVVSGTWDLGWRNGFSVDEAEQTVNDVEKLLISELIEEMFT